MKEIEKYIGYYLLVYLVVLAFCGFFQYMYECQGQSLSCAFSKDGFNTIITTTAYVLTPIVAIIGFTNWKEQNKHNKIQEIIISFYRRISHLRKNIVRLKLDKTLVYLENYHHLETSDFKNKIEDLRLEYNLRLNKLRNEYDELNNELSLLEFYANQKIKDEFEPILDRYFRLIERLDNAYIEYTGFHLNFKEVNISYQEVYLYKACKCQIGLVINSGLTSGDGKSPLLGSFECLKEIQDKTIKALNNLNTLK